MKKTLLSLLMAVVMTAGVTAQEIPDGGFENWVQKQWPVLRLYDRYLDDLERFV